MTDSALQWTGTILFVLAILHTFSVGFFHKLGDKAREGSIQENLYHFLGEVEVVFGLWAALFLVFYVGLENHNRAIHYLEGLSFTEPVFVFVIMCMAATRPVILLAEKIIFLISKILPLPQKMAFYLATLIVGPLLGSLITEPAAMTVTALILLDYFYSGKMNEKFKYATIGLLFVNVSIGGTLTHFAAPPVLMVAGKWGWDMAFMMEHFGFKAITAIVISTIGTVFFFKKELQGPLEIHERHAQSLQPTWWMTSLHFLFLAAVVMSAHHMVVFVGLFLFFIGFVSVTKEYQEPLKIKESLLVGFFLAGLVVLGGVQDWWLKDLLRNMNDLSLFLGATALTAVTDNAALTYLGSLVSLSDSAKYNLMAGAVCGGGLSVIANAPNPAGYGILKSRFKGEIVSPLYLFLAALPPTVVACLCYEFLPSF